jgi:hypothetical protein
MTEPPNRIKMDEVTTGSESVDLALARSDRDQKNNRTPRASSKKEEASSLRALLSIANLRFPRRTTN